MAVAETFTPQALMVTPAAVNKIKKLITEEGDENLKLRVFVTGGGCSGFQYGFSFDAESDEDDTIVEKDGVKVVVDPLSYQYVVGARVDYVEGLEGSRFLVENPNAGTTCGCGMSFSM